MSGAKTRRRGRPPDAKVVARVQRSARPDVAREFERLSIATAGELCKRLRKGESITIELLGVMKLCAEWHTDFLSVQMAGGAPEDPTGIETPPKP